MTYRIVKESFSFLGSGMALPGRPLTNDDVVEKLKGLGFSGIREFSFIARKSGIVTRHFCRDMRGGMEVARQGDSNPDLAARAMSEALDEAGLDVGELGYIFGHTTTPRTLLPPNVSWVADLLEYQGPYAELRQACTGFANALQLASGMLRDTEHAPVGIVGSETGSVFLDPLCAHNGKDQVVNLAQMGDGAAAVIIAPDRGTEGPRIDTLFYGSAGMGKKPGLTLSFGGSGNPFFCKDATVSTFDHDFEYIKDSGLTLFVSGMKAIRNAGVNPDRIQWVIPHQANGKMVDFLSPSLDIPRRKFVTSGDVVGNTGSASVWIALHKLRRSGELRNGDQVLVLGAEATKFLYGGFIYHHYE
jgi:3-oxoacyl-[acyl-carrier-protein] synthase III